MGLFLMTFIESTNLFFEHFGQDVLYKGVIYKGILEQPDEVIADGIVLTTDFELTSKQSDLGSVLFDEELEIDKNKYKVRSVRKIDDGIFCKISLSKV